MQIDHFSVRDFPAIETVGLDQGDFRVRVCIVTEEIIGPVRNGGIASTYYHLSKGLAAQGHEVHVLFLKGPIVQDETPEHWVQHFADFGVTLHYLEVPPGPKIGPSIEWQDRFMAAYRWLRDQPVFDVVHTSEWRGGLIYALMAKRLGLAFAETLFLVKTSSPHIWNRHYQMQPIEKRNLLSVAYAEQKCVELADMVIGGSAHLITFMAEIGYQLPPANVFVQPNIVDFSKVIVTDQRAPRHPGDVVKTRDIVFFGRLEARKGVEMFCNAIDILKERGATPDSVTFMGKWGAALATQGGMKVEDYIVGKSAVWNIPVTLMTDKNQPEALSYMCARDMIAVMPSLIENSTMAVYEALENRIPFIATAVGGTPELIDPADHSACLVEPKADALANRLEIVLRDGQVIPRSSFSNAENLKVWYGFHAFLGRKIAEQGRKAAIADLTRGVATQGAAINSIAVAVLLRRGHDLWDFVDALVADPPDEVVLACTDAFLRPSALTAVARLTAAGVASRVLDCTGMAAGDALNDLVSDLTHDAMVVADGTLVYPRPGFLAAAKTALSARPEAFFTTFYQADGDTLGMPFGGDAAAQVLGLNAYGPELLTLTRRRYHALGPFEPYDVRHGLLHEYVSRNVLKGGGDLLVYPEILLDWPTAQADTKELAQDTVYAYLKAKPMIDGSGLPLRKVLLASLNSRTGSLSADLLRDGGRTESEMLWLTPADWKRDDIAASMRNNLVIGLDEAKSRLWLYARGAGHRTLRVNGLEEQITLVEAVNRGGPDEITISRFDIPTSWESGNSYAMRWELSSADPEVPAKTRFIRITRVSDNLSVLAARQTVCSAPAMLEMVGHQMRVAEAHVSRDLSDSAGLAAALDTGLLTEGVDIWQSDHDPAAALGGDTFAALAAFDGSLNNPKRPAKAVKARKSRQDGLEAALRATDTTTQHWGVLSAAGIGGSFERDAAILASGQVLREIGPAASWPDRGRAFELRAGVELAEERCWKAGSWIRGWAWDRANPDHTLSVAVVHDGKPLFATRATVVTERAGTPATGAKRHGFRIPVLAEWLDLAGPLSLLVAEGGDAVNRGLLQPGRLQNGEPCLFPVTMPGDADLDQPVFEALRKSALVIADFANESPTDLFGPDADIRSGLVGATHHVWRKGNWIEGWVWNRANHSTFLRIAVMRGDLPIFAAKADTVIPHLGVKVPGLEKHGFRIPVLDEMLVEGELVQILILETGSNIKNGVLCRAQEADAAAGIRVQFD